MPFDVRRHELGRALEDRLLDVRLGRGVDDHVHPGDDLAHEPCIADVAVDEREPRVAHHVREVLEVPRVRERVERHDLVVVCVEEMADEVGRDEPRAAGDQTRLMRLILSGRP